MTNYVIYNGQLYHAEGKERKDHKYYAREFVKRKNGKNIYRYFYTRAEYLASKQKSKQVKNQNGSTKTPQTSEERYRRIQQANYTRKNHIQTSEERYRAIQKANYSKKHTPQTSEQIYRNIQRGIKPTPSKPSQANRFDDENLTAKLPNGTTKQFESKDEYQEYRERLEYQNNEPEFMKDIPDIDENTVYTKIDDQEKINEEYRSDDPATAMNCSNCSVAYELRRRGYDVEAREMDSNYDGSYANLYRYYEDVEMLGVGSDGSTVKMDEDFMISLHYSGDIGLSDMVEHRDEYNFWTGTESYTAESIEKAITDNNPPGSRGEIAVQWKDSDGAGHSIVYDVDLDGKVTIRDSQTYDEYDLSELAPYVERVSITRTDNLELKEDVLRCVQPNDDDLRLYYQDTHITYPYHGQRIKH